MTTTQVRVANTAAAPTGQAVAAIGTGGTFAAASYFWKITRRTIFGESQPSGEVTVAIALNGSASLSWTAAPAGTVAIRIYRGTVTNTENVLVAELEPNVTSYIDTGSSIVAATPPAAPAAFANANLDSVGRALKTTGALSGLTSGQLAGALRAINEWHNNPIGTLRSPKILAAVGLAIQDV